VARGVTITASVIFDRTPAIRKAMSPLTAQAVRATAFAIEAGWKRRAHVLTGAYRNSIRTMHPPGAHTAYVFTNIEYAPFEEFGTRFRPGHPAMRPAVEEQRPLYVDRMKAAMQQAARA
jgi:HK97 gp10 family phage protein